MTASASGHGRPAAHTHTHTHEHTGKKLDRGRNVKCWSRASSAGRHCFVYLLGQFEVLHQVLLSLSQLKYSLEGESELEILVPNICLEYLRPQTNRAMRVNDVVVLKRTRSKKYNTRFYEGREEDDRFHPPRYDSERKCKV